MTRQSISLTMPNNDWLNTQVSTEEYSSKSEVVNDLIRKQRHQEKEIEIIRAKLIEGEKSGTSTKTMEEILTKSKEKLRLNGEL